MTAKKQVKGLHKDAYHPPDYDAFDAVCLQAMYRGEASPEQQRRGLDWIITLACATYDMSARPGDPYATYFAEGRRFAGNAIVKLLKLKTGAMNE